jgi:hypothetical protein
VGTIDQNPQHRKKIGEALDLVENDEAAQRLECQPRVGQLREKVRENRIRSIYGC